MGQQNSEELTPASTMASVRVGTRVQIKDKDLRGTVAYVGLTEFAAGKWIGVALDDAKGKNNGSVQGKAYFQCEDKHGMFVRQTQILVLDEEGGAATPRAGSSRGSPSPSPRGLATPTEAAAATPKTATTPTKIPGSRSSIPKPGTVPRGPTGSRQPSYTNIKREKREPPGSGGPSGATGGMAKEKSFVEKGFVETMKQPTVEVKPASESTPMKRGSIAASATTPQPFVGSPALQERLEEKVANLQREQELQQSKETIKDLEEKLETIKIKRAKELEKLKEFEKMKFAHEQLLEFKSRIMESQAALQKDLQKAKHEAREAMEAKEKVAEETAELSETVELATLDKEMAEEKAETLQLELDAAKEKIEELQGCHSIRFGQIFNVFSHSESVFSG